MQSHTVALIDRDQLFSAALATLLLEENYQTIASWTNLSDAMRALDTNIQPSFIIIDPAALGASVSEGLTHIAAVAGAAGLLVLSSDVSDEALRASIDAGIGGHMSKGAGIDSICRALQLIGLGQAVFPPRALRLMDKAQPVEPEQAGDLSRRETQILACVLAGQSNKAIARRLAITESTVKMHFKNVMRKIQASNRTQAAVWAIEHGIAPVG